MNELTVKELNELPTSEIEKEIKNNDGKTFIEAIDVLDRGEVIGLTRLVTKHVEAEFKTATMKEFKAHLTRTIFRRGVENVIGVFPNSPTEFIEIYFNNHQVDLSRKGTLTRNNAYDDSEDTTEALVRDIKLLNDNLKLKFQDKMLDYAYDSVRDKHLSDKKERVKELIQFNKKAKKLAAEDWNKLAKEIFTIDDDNDLAIAMLQKFMWQVKRKLHGLPVTDHVMAILYSPHQGVGKTYFIAKLTKVLADFSSEINFDEMTDNRSVDVWHSYILSITEMSKAEQQNIQILRQRITGESWSYRPMGTNRNATVINKATFIGDSNEALDTLIRDTKGMRRFAQLDWRLTKEQDKTQAWKFINDLDYVRLWQSVDETAEDPTKKFIDKVAEIQEKFRSLSQVEMWLDDVDRDKHRKRHVIFDQQSKQMEEHPCPYEDWTTWKKLADLFRDNFDPWQKENGGSFSKNGFSKELKSLYKAGKYGLEYKNTGNIPQWRILHLYTNVPDVEEEEEKAEIEKKLADLKKANSKANSN